MAQQRQLCHAGSVRCSQNPWCRFPCRQGGGRSSTQVDPGAGRRAGRRPCADRTWPNIGCCRSRDHRRAVSLACQAGNCLSIEIVAAKPSRDDSAAGDVMQIINPLGSEQRPSTQWRGVERRSTIWSLGRVRYAWSPCFSAISSTRLAAQPL
jgi:hypothetical protein